jgi:hypothetical protein
MFELTDQAFTPYNRSWCQQPAWQILSGPPPGPRGIIWKLHTGRPWRDVPVRFGALADLQQPAAPLAAEWDLAQDLGVLATGEHGSGLSGHDRRGQAALAGRQ